MYQRILVALDGGAASLRGLNEGIRLAKATGAHLLLVHVVDPLNLETDGPPTAYYQALVDEVCSSDAQILKHAAMVVNGAGVSFEQRKIEKIGAHAWEEIVAQTNDWHADLIVLGTHGRRSLKRRVMGSDAELVLRHSSVPVLMVRDQLTAQEN